MLIRSAVTANVATAAKTTTARKSRRDRPASGLLGLFMRTPGRNGDEARRCRLRVSDGIVAASALKAFRFAVYYISVDRRRDRFMAPAAGVLHHLVIELGDLDRVGISAASEIKRMPETVVRLHSIFPHNVVWSVAIVACRHRVMARFHPGVVLRLHHVTVCAGSGIVRQVGISLGINKGISRKPNGHSQNDGGKKTDRDRARCTKDSD